MSQKFASAAALLAFVICLISGAVAGNDFLSVVLRALGAMVVTFIVGMIVGAMAQQMLKENLKSESEKLKNDAVPVPSDGR